MPVIMPDNVPPTQSLTQIMQTNILFPTRLETDGSAASRLQDEPKALRTATLLTCISPDALEVFGAFVFGKKDEVLRKFEDYYVGVTNEIYEHSNSRVRKKVSWLIPLLLPSAASLRRAIMADYQIISYETVL